MPPSTLAGLLLFLWVVTPGFLFSLLAGRRRAAAKTSVFQETARVVLASVAFSSLAAAAASIVVTRARESVDLGRLIGEGRPYLSQHYQTVGAFLGLQLAVACSLAVLVNLFEIWRIRGATDQAPPRLTQESAWDRPLGRLPAGSRAQVWLRLPSGIELTGAVAAFGHEIDVRERELVLKDPIEIRYPDKPVQPVAHQRVIVQGADVEFLAVQYVEDGNTNVLQQRWWKRCRKTETSTTPKRNGYR